MLGEHARHVRDAQAQVMPLVTSSIVSSAFRDAVGLKREMWHAMPRGSAVWQGAHACSLPRSRTTADAVGSGAASPIAVVDGRAGPVGRCETTGVHRAFERWRGRPCPDHVGCVQFDALFVRREDPSTR